MRTKKRKGNLNASSACTSAISSTMNSNEYTWNGKLFGQFENVERPKQLFSSFVESKNNDRDSERMRGEERIAGDKNNENEEKIATKIIIL